MKNGTKRLFQTSAVLLSLCCGLMSTGCSKSTYTPDLPTENETADIYVEAIDGISDDFIRGVDISTVIAEENSGVTYYDYDGNEADIFQVLADSGVNYIRVRVWNDPYDADGNGYGGGNCDVETAAEIGKRAAKYGMKLCVDFHYSDFWADPSKQMVPKAWEDMTQEEMCDALYTFTKESLNTIIKAGGDVGIVQVGNEINYGMCGVTNWDKKCDLLNAGAKAVREVSDAHKNMDIQVALHFTDISDAEEISTIAQRLVVHEVDYDIFAVSYYTYWHGSFENLENVLNTLVTDYGKKVMVAETSYPYTTEDTDGNGNSVGEADLSEDYQASVQDQATLVRDVCAAVASVGENGLGVFYWEPAWIAVNAYDWSADDASEVLAANKEAWESYGSGWASSYSAAYDPDDAGVYYGGSAWDNQAMFDATGHPLASLNVWKYLKYGATCEETIEFAKNAYIEINAKDELVMPETVYAVYNKRSDSGEVPVTWNADEVAAVDTGVLGDYYVTGTVEGGVEVTCQVHVTNMNYVQNFSFEDTDYSMWNVTESVADSTDYQVKEGDANTGTTAFHFWATSEYDFTIEQTIDGLDDGKYQFSMYAQGGDVGDAAEMYIYVITADGTRYEQTFMVDGWADWQYALIPEIDVTGGSVTVGAYLKSAAGGWGTFDDFYLCKVPE